jgi:hypothetical protein
VQTPLRQYSPPQQSALEVASAQAPPLVRQQFSAPSLA